MKIVLKTTVAVLIFFSYYVIFCAIEGINLGDPWNKLMKWAKK